VRLGKASWKLAADGKLEAVRPDGDVATLRLVYIPAGDGLAALTAAATPPSSVDPERVGCFRSSAKR
jgi:hypothetical protein